MIVTREKPEFKPVNIILQTEEEVRLLKKIAGSHGTVAHALSTAGGVHSRNADYAPIHEFLATLRRSLDNA